MSMIFPYIHRKAYLAIPSGGNLVVQTTGTTEVVQAGQFGLCTVPNGIEGSFMAAPTAYVPVKLVTGSFQTIDKIAPFYGGLSAPIYSKSIDPRKVTRLIQSLSAAAQQQIVSIGWNQLSGSTVGPVFYCGQSYNLGLNIQGSAALRLLNHQFYITLPAYGGCCGTDCSSGCTSTAVDAAFIMLQWSDYINYGTITPGVGSPSMNSNAGSIPYIKQFFAPVVWVQNGATKTQVYSAADVAAAQAGTYGSSAQNAAAIAAGVYIPNTATPTAVVASFQLTGSYFDNKNGNCTFTPSDYVEIEPVFCSASLVTQDFSQCGFNTTINTSVPNMFTQLQAPVYPKGLGEQVVRELILSQRYRQDHFADSIYVDSLRMREIEQQTWITTNVNRQAYYDVIAIVYNVNGTTDNPSSVSNNLQYADLIYMPAGTNASSFTSALTTWLTNSGNTIPLEITNSSTGAGI